MFAPLGYVSLAELWRTFVTRRAEGICSRTRLAYPRDLAKYDISLSVRGSPADFVEDAFIRSFDGMKLVLCGADGRKTTVLASDHHGYPRRLERLSAFEAAVVIREDGSARENERWLRELGGTNFALWPPDCDHHAEWRRIYVTGEHARTPFEQLPFHTVPYVFRRHQFVIPEQMPPWSDDAIDTSFIGSVAPYALGHSFCVEEEMAVRWAKLALSEQRPKGRPSKRQAAAAAYHQIFPDGHPEYMGSGPGGIGSESGTDTADLHLANDRTLHAWLGYAGRYSDKTVDSHIASIRYFEDVTGGKPFAMLTREDVAKVRDELKRRAGADAPDPLSASTIRHRQSHIASFLDWLRKQDGFRRLPRDLVDYLELPRAATASALREAPRKYPSIAEAADLLDAMPKTSLPDRRARAIFAVAFLGGLRADTIASLRVGDIDVENQRIRQDSRRARTKAGKSLEIAWFPIPDAFETAVTHWIGTLRRFGFTPDDALFPKSEHLKHRFPKPGGTPVPVPLSTSAVTAAFALASRTGSCTYTPHAAKHTIAAERDIRPLTRLQRKAWSENMGHESEQTTETYYGKLNQQQRLELIEGIRDDSDRYAPKMTDEEKIAIVDSVIKSLGSW